MLVFGDRRERVGSRERLAAIDESLCRLVEQPAGIGRHSALAAAVIEGGRLLQGVADAVFSEMEHDRATMQTEALGIWLLALAQMLRRSWDTQFADVGDVPDVPQIGSLPESVELKDPEGFAFYAVYPEAYLEAARRLRLVAPPRVIGIRSIGTSLGAIVAAALDAEPPVTVRPFGDPFDRRVAFDGAIERRLLDGDAHYVIVDEGPGQSGSSFGAVADWLQERGVPLERIAFLPSHGGPLGPDASSAHRQRWQQAQRQTADLGDRLPYLVKAWIGEFLGPLDGELRDLSGGEWRRMVFDDEAQWPATIPMFERRKFLASSGSRSFLARFAGLGRIGENKLRIAHALHGAGFVPKPIGLVHGFLVEQWRADATPLAAGERPVEAIGHYIGARAQLFTAGDADGASIAELYGMARRNISLGLGATAAAALKLWEPRLRQLEPRVRRVRSDNRLDRHEWLRTTDGQLLKADSLDHHQAHDLIGCQDIAWDVAGAIVEFELANGETERLINAASDAFDAAVDRELLDFYLVAYCAFRLGAATMGADLAGDPREKHRLNAATACYGRRLECRLERSSAPTPRECSVD